MTNKKINDPKGDALSKFFSDNGANVIDVTPDEEEYMTKREKEDLEMWEEGFDAGYKEGRKEEREKIKRKLIKTKILDDKLEKIINEL